MILLDTNVVSEVMRPRRERNANVVAWFRQNGHLPVYLSSISEAELWLGVYTLPEGKRRAALATAIGAMLTHDFAERILVFESRAALAYGQIFGRRKSLGRPITHEDCAIAAIARVHGMRIATRNIEDFEHCDVAMIDPWHG